MKQTNKKKNETILKKDPQWTVVAFRMKCGCCRGRDELIYSDGCGGLKCPDHPDIGIDYILKECLGCSKILNVKPKYLRTMRCKDCQVIHKRRLNRKCVTKKKESQQKRAERMLSAENAWDCAHRVDCLDKLAKSGDFVACLPCLGCDRYASISDYQEAI